MPLLSLPSAVDKLAVEVPDNVWVKIPSSSSDVQNLIWHDFTWRQFSSAVDLMARWIDDHLGQAASPSHGNEVITYTAVNDIRYPIVMLAGLKAGYKTLLSSPRNSFDGHTSLIKAAECHKLLYSKELGAQAQQVAESFDGRLRIAQVPDLEDIITATNATGGRPPYNSRCPDIMDDQDTVVILHSSGTTGLPKPVYIKAGVLAVAESLVRDMPTPEGRLNTHDPLYQTKLIVSMPPLFHGFGMNLLVRTIYYQGPMVLFPPSMPPTAELMIRAIKQTNPTGIACTPSILEDICALPYGLEVLSGLDFVYYGGAPLARGCGDAVSKKVTLINGMGTTEIWNATGFTPADPADWEYAEWNPAAGIVMETTKSDNLAELVIKRMSGEDSRFQFVFHNFPDLDEWRTKDLFERHPTKPGLWRYVGRADDIIVLSNGEKLNPVTFEKIVEGHPLVKGVLMVGANRFQAGLVVELHPRVNTRCTEESLVEQVWPWVEQANKQYPAHARVWRTMIAFASPDKPFPRTPKGSVMRRGALSLYEREINSLYGGQEAQHSQATRAQMTDGATIRNIVRQAVIDITQKEYPVGGDETSFFSMGFDSLRVLQLMHILTRGLPASLRAAVSQRVIYTNPTTQKLTRALTSSLAKTSTADGVSREEMMSRLTHQYRASRARKRSSNARSGALARAPALRIRAILTGSTGSLGTHLLHNLLADPTISHVYCLNRSSDAEERQRQTLTSHSLPSDLDPARVTFLQADLSQPNLGLSHATYNDLLRHKVQKIVHNAWPVNFNLSLADFEPSIIGTKNLVDLAVASSAEFVFVSSIASVMNYPFIRSPSSSGSSSEILIPESFEADNSLPLKQGYAESKHVASAIIAKAARNKLLKKATLLRLGQIAGPTGGSGVWNRHEWLPSLVATSLALGKIPARLAGKQAEIDWVPVDLAARAILEISGSSFPATPVSGYPADTRALECWNVVNPRVAQWEDILPILQESHPEVEAVEISEWLDALALQQDSKRYPALKLMDFFEEWRASEESGEGAVMRFETKTAREKSQTMREMQAVDRGLMKKWLEGWAF